MTRSKSALLGAVIALASVASSGHAQTLTGDDTPLLRVVPQPDPFRIQAARELVSPTQIVSVRNQSVAATFSGSDLLPSSWVGEYILKVSGKQQDGSPFSKDYKINYDPPRAGLTTAVAGRLRIPALVKETRDAQGRLPITTERLMRANGTPMSGTVKIKAALSADSEMPLIVNGVTVHPGSPPVELGNYNFNSTAALSLPLSAAENGLEGTANLLILLGDSSAPVVEARVETWAAGIEIIADNWHVRQALDRFSASIKASGLLPCKVQVSQTPNRSPDICRVAFSKLPEGVSVTTGGKLDGRVWEQGPQEIKYNLFYHDGTNEVPFATGTNIVYASTIQGALAFGPSVEPKPIIRGIDAVNISMVQTAGPACNVMANLDLAKNVSKTGLGCVLKWQNLPAGLSGDSGAAGAKLTGRIQTPGDVEAAWEAAIVSPAGTEILVANGTIGIPSQEPEPPTLQFVPSVDNKNGKLLVPVAGGTIGDLKIIAMKSDLGITATFGGVLLQQEVISGGTSKSALVSTSRKLKGPVGKVWASDSYKARVYYINAPDIGTDVDLDITSVASTSIQPVIEAMQTQAIDEANFPVKVSIRDSVQQGKSYDPDIMGTWEVRVIKMGTSGASEPITGYQVATEGTVTFDLDMAGLGGQNVSLNAEARLVTSDEAMGRTVLGTRAIRIGVLMAGDVSGTLTTNKLAGPAPLSTTFQIKYDSSVDQASSGGISWEVRKEGETWTEIGGTSQNKVRLVHSFEAGNYEVRAAIRNKTSGVISYTNTTGIEAFNLPSVAITGPTQALVGMDVTLNSNVRIQSGTSADIEWSVDGGQTWDKGEETLTITSNVERKFAVMVRAKAATSSDTPTAWKIAKYSTEFVIVRPPRVNIVGSRTVETGQQVTFSAAMTSPYPKVQGIRMNGRWEMPDGKTVEGPEIVWTPDESLASQQSAEIKFTGWIEGYEDKGGLTQAKASVRVWTYRWPNWSLTTRTNYAYSPTDGVLRVVADSSTSNIKNLTYTWSTPPEVSMLEGSGGQRRIKVATSGAHSVRVSVRDARGNVTDLSTLLVAQPPPPLVVTMDVYPSNKFSREPLNLQVRTKVTGGHPADRPSQYAYSVSNAQVQGNRSTEKITLDKAGNHTVVATVKTVMGNEGRAELPVQVKVNRQPICGLESSESATAYNYWANCTDSDGTVTSYRWFADGVEQGVKGKRFTITKKNQATRPVVMLIGVDDAGAESLPMTQQ